MQSSQSSSFWNTYVQFGVGIEKTYFEFQVHYFTIKYYTRITSYPSVLDFWKIKFEKFSLTNGISNLQKSISKLIFAGYTCSKNQVGNWIKILFVDPAFSNLIFQKWGTDG